MSNRLFNPSRIGLGDARLNKRFAICVEQSLRQPAMSTLGIFKNWHQTKASYRFFDNPKVTEEKLLQ